MNLEMIQWLIKHIDDKTFKVTSYGIGGVTLTDGLFGWVKTLFINITPEHINVFQSSAGVIMLILGWGLSQYLRYQKFKAEERRAEERHRQELNQDKEKFNKEMNNFSDN